MLQSEGGYVNHPADRGGATNRGVTQLTYDTYRRIHGLPIQDVRQLTEEEVQAIYSKGYWQTTSCDHLPWPVNLVVFDCAVNSGPLRAAKMLQQELGVVADGAIGPKTLAAVAAVDPIQLATRYLDRRDEFYGAIVKGNPSQSVFLKGWLNRTSRLRKLF